MLRLGQCETRDQDYNAGYSRLRRGRLRPPCRDLLPQHLLHRVQCQGRSLVQVVRLVERGALGQPREIDRYRLRVRRRHLRIALRR